MNTYISSDKPRQNWEEAFREMHKNGHDRLLIPDIFEDEVLEEEE